MLTTQEESGPAAFTVRGRRFLFFNSISWVASRSLSGIVRVGILLAIARVFGPQNFGRISVAVSLVEILRAFSDFGLDTIAIRRFAQTGPAEHSHLLGRIVGSKLLLSVCSYVAGVAILFWIAHDSRVVAVGAIAGLSLLFASAFGALASYYQSSFSMSRVLATTVVSSLVSLVFAAVVLAKSSSILLAVAALPISDALALVLLWRRSMVSFRVTFAFQDTASLLGESPPASVFRA